MLCLILEGRVWEWDKLTMSWVVKQDDIIISSIPFHDMIYLLKNKVELL